jgi:methionyl-tRNA synthetase
MADTIQFSDFTKVEMRVGLVTAVSAPEWSEKLLEFSADFGPEIGTRRVLSGVRQWYSEADFLNKKFPFVVNLAERKMGPSSSQGMMMMVDGPDKPILIELNEQAKVGDPLA